MDLSLSLHANTLHCTTALIYQLFTGKFIANYNLLVNSKHNVMLCSSVSYIPLSASLWKPVWTRVNFVMITWFTNLHTM